MCIIYCHHILFCLLFLPWLFFLCKSWTQVAKSEMERSYFSFCKKHINFHLIIGGFGPIFHLLCLKLGIFIVLNFIMQLRSLALPFTVLEWTLPTIPRPSSKEHSAMLSDETSSPETSLPNASTKDTSEFKIVFSIFFLSIYLSA